MFIYFTANYFVFVVVLKEKDGVPRLRQHGGLSKLIYLVETTNQKVLDVTLSILGNCCMEERTRKDVSKSLFCHSFLSRILYLITARQRSCGKVMFSQVCVCLRKGGEWVCLVSGPFWGGVGGVYAWSQTPSEGYVWGVGMSRDGWVLAPLH